MRAWWCPWEVFFGVQYFLAAGEEGFFAGQKATVIIFFGFSCGVTLDLRSISPDLQKDYSGGIELNDSGSRSNRVSQANKIWFKCKLVSVDERGRKG